MKSRSRYLSSDTLIYLLYQGKDEPARANDCIRKLIHRLRQKGVKIDNQHAVGYRLSEERDGQETSQLPVDQRAVC